MPISVRVITLLIVVTVLPFFVVAGGVYWFGVAQSSANVYERLTDEVGDTAAQVGAYIATREKEVATTASIAALVRATPALMRSATTPTSAEYRAARVPVDAILGYLPKLHEYTDVEVISPTGIIVYTTLPTNTVIGQRAEGDDLTAYTSGQVGPYRSQTIVSEGSSQRFSLIFSHPMKGEDGTLSGIFVVHVPVDSLFRDLQLISGFPQTGENYLGISNGVTLSLMTPLRSDSATDGLRTTSTSDAKFGPLLSASRGKSGTAAMVGYKNTKVFAAYQYIPLLQWGIVAQVDESEGLAVVRRIAVPLITGVALAALIIIFLIVFVTRRWIRKPLEHLVDVTRHIEHNDYEHAVVDPKYLYSQDVIGRLGTHLQHIVNEHKHHDHKKTSEHNDI